mgnify:CR=1 FL=1
MHQRLVAGMTDAKAQTFVIIADMGGDRAQAVMAGDAAADFDPAFGRSEIEFVVKDAVRCTASP